MPAKSTQASLRQPAKCSASFQHAEDAHRAVQDARFSVFPLSAVRPPRGAHPPRPGRQTYARKGTYPKNTQRRVPATKRASSAPASIGPGYSTFPKWGAAKASSLSPASCTPLEGTPAPRPLSSPRRVSLLPLQRLAGRSQKGLDPPPPSRTLKAEKTSSCSCQGRKRSQSKLLLRQLRDDDAVQRRLAKKGRFDACILDEAHYLKNPDSKRFPQLQKKCCAAPKKSSSFSTCSLVPLSAPATPICTQCSPCSAPTSF